MNGMMMIQRLFPRTIKLCTFSFVHLVETDSTRCNNSKMHKKFGILLKSLMREQSKWKRIKNPCLFINMSFSRWSQMNQFKPCSIDSMIIVNGLKAIGKTYTHSKLVRKILGSLPKPWAPIKNAIQEVKDLSRRRGNKREQEEGK